MSDNFIPGLPHSMLTMKKYYPGWATLVEKTCEKKLTANDVKRITGISYRQINDWDNKGVLPPSRETSEGWRKFSVFDLIWLSVIQILKSKGIAVSKLREWRHLTGVPSGIILNYVPSFVHGREIYMVTDFINSWGFTNEPNIADSIKDNITVVIALSGIVNAIVDKLDLPFYKVERNKDGYKFIIDGIPLRLEETK